MPRCSKPALLLLCAMSLAALGGEIGYLEDFALAPNRAETLKSLIPGSEDYYYYSCLYYQQTQQFAKVDELLKLWIQRYKDSPRLREMQNRQALLTYDAHPAETLEFLRQRLGLRFDHQRVTLGAKPNLPVVLDDAVIDRERLTNEALQRHPNLAGFEDSALDWLMTRSLNTERRRHLLERLTRPDWPQLPQLIVAELNDPLAKPFGGLPIHHLLLQEQLDELLRLRPDLLNQAEFVNIYLPRLQPGDDVNLQYEAEEREAHLDRLWNFAQPLSPAHNSLKAHVLFHRLVHDRARGVYNKERFLTYLGLPRTAEYVQPRLLELGENRRFPADLNAEYASATRLPAIGTDEPLVRSYLQHFFLDETSTKPYEPFIRDDYLREVFAETKIVHGLGEPEQWYSLLPPEKYQALKDRVDLDFAPTNQQYFSGDGPIQLDVFVKNVRTLIVKVFEINTLNYYRQQLREVNSDIMLDGLVANEEQTYQYEETPLRRVRRHFEFPQLKQPGVYVVDFIGNGVSSRAVVRKGKLQYLVRTSTAGHVFTVFDERHQPVPDAQVWLAGHEYRPNDRGQVVVPFSAAPGRQKIVLSRGAFASLDEFQHDAENYTLAAGIYVDRESLLTQQKATVVIRPALYLNGTPVTLSVLENVRLVVTSADHDGVASTKETKDFPLLEDRESVFEFQVPPRLAQLQFSLQAQVQSLSQNKKIDVAATETFQLNGIDPTDKIEDLHFAKISDQYALEIRGKTGEAKADRPVQISLKHRDFTEPVVVMLQTDAAGRIRLGLLPDIVAITATGPNGTSRTWNLLPDRHAYPQTLHGLVGRPLTVPYMGPSAEPARAELSLLERRGDAFLRDRFDALSLRNGLLQIQGLPRGDYDLLLRATGQRIHVRLTSGPEQQGYVLGNSRRLEVRNAAPLQISQVAVQDDALRVHLQNATKFARVHVFATRYAPAYSAFDQLARVTAPEPFAYNSVQPASLYVAGRNIGDEYRYIIDRKYAAKFPGNMLERPSLLLNPWVLRSTETDRQTAAKGEEFAPQAEPPRSAATQSEAATAPAVQNSDFANLDFLADASVVVLNQTADDQGIVTIRREALGPHQHLHVVAVDPESLAYRSVTVAETEIRLADLRLRNGLDSQSHFTQQKRISVVQPDAKFVLPDIVTSRLEIYDSLARVYTLFTALQDDANLREFRFLVDWPNLAPEKKRELYAKYASHELNFFLCKKDPAFFEQIIQPYLRNKLHKTFLDDWLIGVPLQSYLEPWKYARLNVVERILLSQRIAEDRPFAQQLIAQQFEVLPPDTDRFQFLFNSALLGRALETTDSLSFGAMRGKAQGELSLGFARGVVSLPALDAAVSSNFAAVPPPAPAPAAAEPATAAAADKPAERPSLARRAARERLEEKQAKSDRAANGKAAGQYFFGEEVKLREQVRQLYQRLDKTQEWAENNYYHLPIEQQNADLVKVNAFWRDYAQHDPQQPFLSVNFPFASGNFTEIMFALALLDLPFASAEHKTAYQGAEMTLTAASGLVAFHEEVRRTEIGKDTLPILVSQNFFRPDERFVIENGQQRDKFVTGEFLVQTVYGCQVVVTNPTSAPQKLDILLQIPLGALPVLNTQATRSLQVDLQPYHTQTVEFHFYFPVPGDYPHYPVHVSKNEQLLAFASPVVLKVVAEPSQIDRTSWDYVSQNGTNDEVLQFLRDRNLAQVELQKIAFRMNDASFFQAALELLAKRHVYDTTLWSYGIKHNAAPAIGQFLQHADEFVAQAGDYLASTLLSVDPVERKSYQHLDYRPLVNERAHPLGRRRQIVNERLFEQYQHLLKILSYKRELDADDRMSVIYYLLLQDRVGEAMAAFAQVNADHLETKLQYDYFAAYLALCRGDLESARKSTDRWLQYPVDRWRNAFAALDQQLREIGGAPVQTTDREDRGQNQTNLAATEPAFEFQVEGKNIRINYQQLTEVQAEYYLMDIELLFSRNPFVQQYSSDFANIRPNRVDTVQLPANQNSVQVVLPEELQNRNVLVVLTGGGQSKSQAYYSNAMSLQLIENYGQLRVSDTTTGKPLSKVYVKVYARLQDETVVFYKDGYTDLRGRFDYTSLNTNELDNVQRFALLILSEESGALVREAQPPKR